MRAKALSPEAPILPLPTAAAALFAGATTWPWASWGHDKDCVTISVYFFTNGQVVSFPWNQHVSLLKLP
jgi:hypothetical protein